VEEDGGQCHPVEPGQRGREPTAMRGCNARPPESLSTSPGALLNRALQQKGSHPVSVNCLWWEIFQYCIIVSLGGGGFFCLPGVKKVNGASTILGSGTWCHQELLHTRRGFNYLNLSINQ